MGEDIRFWCARCGQPIVADGNAVGLRADCPNCRRPLIIPPPAHREESENFEFRPPEGLREGAEAKASLQAEVQLAYVREQLEATAETCSRLGVYLACKQRESRFFLLERLSLARELGLVRRLLEEARSELIHQDRNNERAENLSGPCGPMRGTDPQSGRVPGPALLESHSGQCSMLGFSSAGRRVGAAALPPAGGADFLGAEEAYTLEEGVCGRGVEPQPRKRAPLSNAGAADIDALREDNATLRGMIDRQNQELRECYIRLRRYRRAQIGLRIVYGLLVLLGFAIFWESCQFLIEL